MVSPSAAQRGQRIDRPLRRGDPLLETRSADLEGFPLGRWRHREVGIHVGNGGADRRLERGIVPPGIVVERQQVLDACQSGEGQRIVYCTVSPADVTEVLLASLRSPDHARLLAVLVRRGDIAAQIGDMGKATRYGMAALLMDLADVGGNMKDGCHIDSMGGTPEHAAIALRAGERVLRVSNPSARHGGTHGQTVTLLQVIRRPVWRDGDGEALTANGEAEVQIPHPPGIERQRPAAVA
jgi:hypothetical protein